MISICLAILHKAESKTWLINTKQTCGHNSQVFILSSIHFQILFKGDASGGIYEVLTCSQNFSCHPLTLVDIAFVSFALLEWGARLGSILPPFRICFGMFPPLTDVFSLQVWSVSIIGSFRARPWMRAFVICQERRVLFFPLVFRAFVVRPHCLCGVVRLLFACIRNICIVLCVVFMDSTFSDRRGRFFLQFGCRRCRVWGRGESLLRR